MEKINTETETISEDNKTEEAHFYVAHAANAVRPAGSDYVGSFCLHVYQQKFASKDVYSFATQFVGDTPEQLAIEAAKELKERMMARYGHTKTKLK